MDTLNIVLLNIVCYMGGIFSGIGLCFKYKKHLLLKTTSNKQLNELSHSLNDKSNITHTTAGAPVTLEQPLALGQPVAVASAPTSEQFKEVVIRTI